MMHANQEFLSFGHAALVENACHVMPDRAVTNRQRVGNVFGRETLSQPWRA